MDLNFQDNVLLKNYSAFKVGGIADYFFVAKNDQEVKKALQWAKENKIPFFILGKGTNVLFSDEGFKGLVIKMENTKYEIRKNKIIAEAGCPLQTLAIESVKKGLKGLEWAVGIPGTLGGAIYGNAGSFGGEMKDVVQKVKILVLKNKEAEIKEIKNKHCQFAYRDSIFKRKKNWIILEAILKLKKGNEKELAKKVKEILKIRKERQPLEYANAGSIFKNVPLSKVSLKIQEKFKHKIKKEPRLSLPSAVLIEAANLKGKTIGGAKISSKHANFIVNFKEAKAKDIISLIKLIKKRVKEKFNVELEQEIELVGF